MPGFVCLRIVVMLCLTGVLSAQTQMDGSRANELTTDFVTPHLEWVESLEGGKLRALFVVSLSRARLVIEIAQRMPLDYAAVTTALRTYDLAITDHPAYDNLYTGTSRAAKTQELLDKLESEYEVVVIAGVDLGQLPARVKLRILERVQAGAGLVLYDVRGTESLQAIFAHPAPAGEAAIQALAPADPSLRAYSFGAGRIVTAARMNVAPFHYDGPAWWARFENANVLTMRTLLWAGGRNLVAEAPELEGTSARRKANGRLRLRDSWNAVLTENADPVLELPPLPTGTYYLDLVDGSEPGVFTFQVDSGHTAEVTITDDAIDGFSPIRPTLLLNAPVQNGRATVSLIDMPYQRIWYQREILLGDGLEFPLAIEEYHMPTLAATVRVDVHTGETPVASASTIVYFPWYQQHAPLYADTLWEYNPGGVDRIRAIAEYDVMGYSGLLNRIDGDRPSVQTYMHLNLRHGAHNFGFALGNTGIGENLTDEEQESIALAKEDFSIGNPHTEPAIRATVRSMIRHKSLDRYPLAFYGLGNETKLPYTNGFTEADTRFLREMLRDRYGDIATLNAAWGRTYASFDEVPNMPMEEARVNGMYPEYMAHRRLIDETVRRRIEIISDEVARIDPHAHMGCDGTWSLSNDGINMEEILANPRVNHWEQYSRLPRAEVLRSLRPDAGGFLWGWIMANDSYPEAPWFNLLIGCGNHANWFLSGCSIGGMQLSADYRPWRPRMVDELEKLRTGVAQLLNTTPLRGDGLAIWESYTSNVAGLLGDPRLPRSTDTSMPLIDYCYQHGLTFDFVARRGMAEKLAGYRVLVLPGSTAIADDEAAAMLAFVRNGGTLIADLNPGILNDSFGLLAQNRLHELFGRLNSEATPVRAPLSIDTQLNGRHLRLRADAVGQVPGIAPLRVTTYGSGEAILLNFTLGSARESTDAESFATFVGELLAACDVAPHITFTDLPADSIARVRQGDGFSLIGVTHRRLASAGENGDTDIRLNLPENGYVYAVGEGFVASADAITFQLSPPFRLFSVFAGEQSAPPLRLSTTEVTPGMPVRLDLRGLPVGRVLLLQLRDAEGNLVRPRREAVQHEVFLVGDSPDHLVHFPYTTRPGDYQLTLTDVVTGLATSANLVVRR